MLEPNITTSGWENEPHYLVIGERTKGYCRWWHGAEWLKLGGGWLKGGPDFDQPPKGNPTNHHVYQDRLERAKAKRERKNARARLRRMEKKAEAEIEWYDRQQLGVR